MQKKRTFKRKNNCIHKVPYTIKNLKDNIDPLKVKSTLMIAALFYGKKRILDFLDITDPVFVKMTSKGIIPKSYGHTLLKILHEKMVKDELIDEEGYLRKENCYIYDAKFINFGFRSQLIREEKSEKIN